MKDDFRSRYQKGAGSKGRFVSQAGNMSSLDDILTDTYGDIEEVIGTASPLFRFVAFLIDLYIIVLILFIISISIESVSPESIYSLDTVKKIFEDPSAEKVTLCVSWLGLFSIVSLLYYSFLEGSALRASVGKFLMGQAIYSINGDSCSVTKAITRNVFKIVSVASLGVGFLTVLFGRKRCLHDILSKTQVVSIPSLSTTRRILRFIGMSFTLGMVLFSCISFGFFKKNNQVQELDKSIEESVSVVATPTPTPIERGKYGSISVGGSEFQVNGVFLRGKPSDTDVETSNSIFGGASSDVSNSVTVEMVFFEKDLSPEDTKKLQMVYDLLNESESVLGKRVLAKLEIAYDVGMTLCKMDNMQNATLFVNKAVLPNGQAVQLVKGYHKLDRSAIFGVSCSALVYGKDVSLRMIGHSNTLAWNIDTNATYLRYKLYGSSSYTHPQAAVAVFNETSNVMEVGFFDRKLTQNELNVIRAAKTVKAPKLSIFPSAVGTLNLTNPNLKSIKKAALTMLQKKKYLSLSADNVRNGYTVWFRRNGKTVDFMGESNEMVVRYNSPHVPSTFGGMLENNRYVVGRFAGSKRVKLKEGIYKFSWSLSYNTKLIYVK